MTLYEDLKYRNLIKDISSDELIDKLNNESLTFYIGTDPTADSLHIGHLSSFLISKRLKDYGHNPILLIGGATGRIGDPRPTTEREMKSHEEINNNILSLTKQVENIFGFEIVNNYDWSKEINFIDFLRDYGKYFSINYMLDKDIIRRRLDTGITYTEFSYMIMQALDFLYLYESKGCVLQVAGSDQWGNITAGIDLIRKKTGKQAYGFTMPLVTTKNGTKFGKSEGNALWLDKNKTSSYKLYQYFINLDDDMIVDYIKIFTFLSKDEIESISESMLERPEERIGQKTLAKEVITFLHGSLEYERAVKLTEMLFSNQFMDMSSNDIEDIFNKDEVINIEIDSNILDLLVSIGAASSKREAREFVGNNAISVNGIKVNDVDKVISSDSLIDNKYIVIKRGKKNYYIGQV